MSESSTHYSVIATSSKTDCHNMPESIVKATLLCFNGAIALDPCSNSHECPNVPATQLYTNNNNGLSRNWVAETLYMNPPYSNTQAWATKLITHVKAGDVREAIALTKADNRTRWYADLMDACDGFCLYRGYLKFGEAASSAPFASIVFYFGDRPNNFDRAFSPLGWVFRQMRSDQAVIQPVPPKGKPAVSQSDRLLMKLGAEEFLDYMLRGGQYSAVDERTIALASTLEAHRHDLELVGINLTYYDCPTRTVGSLIRWYGHKLSRHQVRVNEERLWVYKLKTATPIIGDKTAIALKEVSQSESSSQQEVNLSPMIGDSKKDCEGEISKLTLREGDRAELYLEDDIGIAIEIVEVLPNEEYLCRDIAGRWRSPLPYHAHELQPIGTHQALL